MTRRYRLRPAADRDLDDQAAYLERQAGLETALRFYAAAGATFEGIARTPGVGERRDSGNPELAEVRVWRVEGFERHLIFYQSAGEDIEIIRVLHGARDVDRLLASVPDEE